MVNAAWYANAEGADAVQDSFAFHSLPPGGLLHVVDEDDEGAGDLTFTDITALRITLSSFLASTGTDTLPGARFAAVLFDLATFGSPPLALLDKAAALLPSDGIVLYRLPNEDAADFRRPSGRNRHRYLVALAAHFGFSPIPGKVSGFGVLQKQRPPRWTVAWPGPEDLEQCRALFRRAFGQDINAALWRWKYDDGRGRAVIARREGKVVAHYGATARRISYFGKEMNALQICDVMVDPAERAVMTRHGVFLHTASAFYESHFGFHNDHLLSYGFPSLRHMRLGEKLGLYGETERIVEVRWSGAPPRKRWGTKAQILASESDHSELLGALWAAMRADLSGSIVIIRDPQYLRYRYLEHPEFHYPFLAVLDRLTGRPRGLAVLRREGDMVRLLDIVAPIDAISLVVDHARRQVALWGGSSMMTWICSRQAKWFAASGGNITETDVCVPTGVWAEGPGAERLRDRWWLMMGDTEFL